MSEKTSAVDMTEVTKIQDRAVDEVAAALRTRQAVLVEAPTGAGKTRIAARTVAAIAEMVRADHGRDPSILNLQHREILADQAERALARWSPEANLSTSMSKDGDLRQDGNSNYATVQTIAARLSDLRPVDAVLVDEAHHASDSKNSDYAKVLDRLFELNPDMKLVATSATLTRPDNKGLSPHLKNATRVTIGWAELERAGQIKLPRTVELRVTAKDGGTVNQVAEKHYRPEKDANSEGLTKAVRNARSDRFHEEMADAWERHRVPGGTIAFHSRIEDARSFAQELQSRGHRVGVVDSKAGDDNNSKALNGFRNGDLDIIVSVKMIDEGVDIPATRNILILRETTSEIEYSQMVGRALRTGEDPALQKVQPLVLDGGASTMIHGAIEKRAVVIDYYQRLERGEFPKERPAELADKAAENGATYTPWRKMQEQPVVLALSDGEGVIFAIESRDPAGNPRYSLAETQNVRGRNQLTFMKGDDGKPLNGIDGQALQSIETKRLIPSRATLLRMEASRASSGRSLMDERIAEASKAHMASVVQFAALAQRNSASR